MARAKKQNVNNTINIKSLPVQCHIGASKFVNDDWGTMAFSIPRNQIQKRFADPELRYNFIYFLFGYENSKEVVYVGQAKKRNNGESVLKRLREHDTSTTEKYRDKWAWIVAVTNKNDAWGLDDLNALEHAFYNEIPANQNLNGNNPNSGGADYEAYADKISQIKSLITAVGFSIFSDEETTEKIQVTSETNEYSIVEDLHNGMARIPEIVTPQKVVKAMVDMLPAEVWNSKTKFLDPACKGGEYLREVYDRLMETEILQSEFPNTIERSNHILKNQIYGIALSQVSLERTTKKLLGEDRNIRVIPNYINKLKGIDMGSRPDGSQQNIMDILNKEFGKDMKFDVVIGNPPYQENTGGGRSVAIFDKFIEFGTKVATISSLITPSRWLTDSKYDKLRKNTLKYMTDIIIYKDCKTAFKGIACGSVSYYLVNKVHESAKINILSIESGIRYNISSNSDIVPLDEYALAIANKCNDNKEAFKFVGRRIFGASPRWSDGAPFLDIFSANTNFDFITYEDGVFNVEKCNKADLNNIEYANYYRLIIASNLNMNKTVIGAMALASPGSASDFNIATLYYSTNKEECYHCSKYVKTKFVRYLILITLSKTQVSISSDRLKYVPAQDYTSKSDIDWSQSIQEIDQQLYKKYNLTEEEIAYIEQTIKPMA